MLLAFLGFIVLALLGVGFILCGLIQLAFITGGLEFIGRSYLVMMLIEFAIGIALSDCWGVLPNSIFFLLRGWRSCFLL
jgi:hypothetical protein